MRVLAVMAVLVGIVQAEETLTYDDAGYSQNQPFPQDNAGVWFDLSDFTGNPDSCFTLTAAWIRFGAPGEYTIEVWAGNGGVFAPTGTPIFQTTLDVVGTSATIVDVGDLDVGRDFWISVDNTGVGGNNQMHVADPIEPGWESHSRRWEDGSTSYIECNDCLLIRAVGIKYLELAPTTWGQTKTIW